jgi:MYXO-CTERM domain-containing protein
VLTGCCRAQFNSTMCEDLVPQPACVDGIFVANGTCASDCKIPDGGSCEDPDDCVSGNCVDDFCCDTACNGPEQQCNLPGQEGVCSSTAAPAPAASPSGLLIGLALLIAVGAVAMLRRARTH